MKRTALRRKVVPSVALTSLAAISFAVTMVVLPAVPAAASSTGTTSATTTSTSSDPASQYFVINGTVDAASVHEILGSSAFPNYATGAVDNYYSLAHSHVDNSPFAEGRASPADTGPAGQTAAAGNFQQTQYADARWPGDSGKATYGSQGQPYASASASSYMATAESSEASNGLSAPGGSTAIAAPKGFDGRLQLALAAWKAKWLGRLGLKPPTAAGTTTPVPTVTTPAVTVTTPTPPPAVGGSAPAPSVTVPSVTVPSALAPKTATPSRSLSAAPADGAFLLESSTQATLDPKSGALVTRGESSLGRVSLGGGQIVAQKIHVSASITNDGTPTNKVAISIGAASIGGVPVTIEEDGVHVAGQGQNLPYQQASDALNGALKQAGIQLFLVAPEVTTSSCDQSGTTSTPTTTTNQTTTTSTDPTSTTPTPSSCDTAPSPCDPTGATTTPTSTTTTSAPTTTTASTDPTGTTPTPTSCEPTGTSTTPTSCAPTGTTTTPTTTSTPTDTTTTTTSSDPTGTAGSGEEKLTATGLHVVFTQPVSQSGVPAQYAEHILGEVALDSLAVPAGPLPNLNLDLNLNLNPNPSCPTHSGGSKSKKSRGASKAGGAKGGGGSSAGGPTSSSSASAPPSPATSSQPAASWAGSASQPTSSSPGNALQASTPSLVSALRRKPLWLLVAYLLWQAMVIATGVSLWSWRRGEAS